MKKLITILFLLPLFSKAIINPPLTGTVSGIKVESIPTTTVCALLDKLIKDNAGGGAGGTKTITVQDFLRGYSVQTRTVNITAVGNATITGTYPNYTITVSGGGSLSGSGTTNYYSIFTNSVTFGNGFLYNSGDTTITSDAKIVINAKGTNTVDVSGIQINNTQANPSNNNYGLSTNVSGSSQYNVGISAAATATGSGRGLGILGQVTTTGSSVPGVGIEVDVASDYQGTGILSKVYTNTATAAYGLDVRMLNGHGASNQSKTGLIIDNTAGGLINTGIDISASGATTNNAIVVNSGNVNLASLTASRVLALNGSNNVVTTSVTTTEVSYLQGATSNIQSQINSIPTGTILAVLINGNSRGVAFGIGTNDGFALSLKTNSISAIDINTSQQSTFNGNLNIVSGKYLYGGGIKSIDPTIGVGYDYSGVGSIYYRNGILTDATDGTQAYDWFNRKFYAIDGSTETMDHNALTLTGPWTLNGVAIATGTATAGSGSVRSFSFTNGGGVNGSVATYSTTPVLTLTVVGSSQLVTTGTVTAGQFRGTKIELAYGGTNADLSATGGTSQVLKQISSGAAITVAQLAASDLSNGTTGSGAVILAVSPAFTGTATATTQAATATGNAVATVDYVNNAVLGQRSKEAVKYASTAALPSIVYSNGSSGVGATLTGVALAAISLDGASPGLNDRVEIKDQVSTFQNGIYVVTQTGSGIAVFILTRATDFDQAADIQTGDNVFVTAGNTLSATTWAYTGADSPVMGTDPITFVQTAGQGSFTGGNGITITGTSIAINTAVTVDKTTAQSLSNKTFVETVTTTPRGVMASQYNTGINSSQFSLNKYRGTVASPSTIVVGDNVGNFIFRGYDGSSLVTGAEILATSTYSVGSGFTPMTLNFKTMNRSGVLTTGLVVDESSNVIGTGSLSASNFSGTFSGSHSGTSTNTNTGDQSLSISNYTIALSGGTNVNLPVEYGVTAGGVDTYTANLSPAISAYTTGLKVFVIFTSANTGACTINYNSVGARSIKKFVSSALISGDIVAGQAYTMIYDGTNFQMLQPGTAQGFILKIRTGDQAVTTNTMTSITDLVYPVFANSVYAIQGVLSISCNNTGGVKFTTTIPTSATMKLNYTGNTSSATVFLGDFLLTSSTVSGAFCTQNASRSIIVSGTVTTGASAGNIQFQMQSTTNLQISTVFQEGTFLRIQKTD